MQHEDQVTISDQFVHRNTFYIQPSMGGVDYQDRIGMIGMMLGKRTEEGN